MRIPGQQKPPQYISCGGAIDNGCAWINFKLLEILSLNLCCNYTVLVWEYLPTASQYLREPYSTEAHQCVLVTQAHSVVFANSGTLLLCCVERSGNLAGFRQRTKATFPGASARQSSIMHVTLGRVLTAEALTEASVASISEAAAKWSARVRGMRWQPGGLTHVVETAFSTVAGVQTELPFSA